MSTSSDHPTIPANPVSEQGCGPTPAQAEIEGLRRRVQQLEDDQARDRQTIAALEAERDAYKRVAYHWALEQVTEEDIERYAQIEDGEPLEAFIGELEEIVEKGRSPEA